MFKDRVIDINKVMSLAEEVLDMNYKLDLCEATYNRVFTDCLISLSIPFNENSNALEKLLKLKQFDEDITYKYGSLYSCVEEVVTKCKNGCAVKTGFCARVAIQCEFVYNAVQNYLN